jgi:dihydroorotase
MPQRLLIRDGLVIDPVSGLESAQDILLSGGRISKVAPGLARRPDLRSIPVLDAEDCWVCPGLIDMHVHLREPGGEDSETMASGAQAAAAGGFATILAMPNTEPPVDSPARVRRARSRAARTASVNILTAGCATRGQAGARPADLAAMAKAGMTAVSEDGRPVSEAGLMRRILELCRELDLPCISHCEDLSLSAGAPVHEGRISRRLGLPGYPWAAETVAVLRDISLAELTGARLHVAHLSSAQSVAAVRAAKARGVAVTAEATPHHLCLCEDDVPAGNADFKMNPPLRSSADREAIKEGLCDGTIDAVASDHAPHSPVRKRLGLLRAPYGVIGLETSLAAVLTCLVHTGRLSRRALVERMSAAPARILGLERKGSLAPGQDADVTVIEPDHSWSVPHEFLSASRNSPFIGRRLTGRVKATVVGGRIVHAL